MFGAAVLAVSSFGAVVQAENAAPVEEAAVTKETVELFENGWDKYTAAYDYTGRLVSVYKTENTDPEDDAANFKLLKTFVWNEKNEPYNDENSIVFDSARYKGITENDSTGYQVQVYDDESRTSYSSYEIAGEPEMYVNGVTADRSIAFNVEELFEDRYVRENMIGQVRLSETGTPDGIYDAVNISYYLDAVVDEVFDRDGETVISFYTYDAYISLGEVALDREYSIHFNGEEITPEEIMPGDVLSIAYDVSKQFRYSGSYDIYVSRNRFSGKVESVDKDIYPMHNRYEMSDGTVYEPAYEDTSRLKEGETYDFYIDVAGRIARAEEVLGIDKFGLLEDAYTTNENAYVDILTGSGRTSYQVDKDDYKNFIEILMEDTDKADTEDKLLYRRAPQNRVIKYDITSDGMLILKNIEEYMFIDGEFNEKTLKLSGKKLSPEHTVILDLTDYKASEVNSGTVVSTEYLKSAVEYQGYLFGCKGSYKTYQFGIIEKATDIDDPPIEPWVDTTPWAVFDRISTVQTDNGDMDEIQAYVNGSLLTFPVKGVVNPGLTTGDLFFYKINSDYEIEEIKPIARMASNYREYYKTAINAGFDIIDGNARCDTDEFELISGAIIGVSDGIIKLATAQELAREIQSINRFSIDYAKDYYFSSDMNVYLYDYSWLKEKARVSTARPHDISNSFFERDSYVGDKRDNIVNFETELEIISQAENLNYGNVNFAVAKVHDNEIIEILVIIPDEEEKVE